jgi:predicted transcriptional regulator
MQPGKLIAVGLSDLQARAYALLLEHGKLTPPVAVKELGLTRTNAYKLLDKLAEMGLAVKEKDKKFVYYPGNPMSLSQLVVDQRVKATQREEAVRQVMGDLLAAYHQHTEQPTVKAVTGRQAVVEAYHEQIRLLEPIYFLRSVADIASMGFQNMHEIRITPARHGVRRYGITPDSSTGAKHPEGDARSNLERTWVKGEDYDAPVEWSVSGPSLLIVLFGAEPHAITITSPIVADAFRQMWALLNNCVRAMPYYPDLPRGSHLEK